MTFDMHVIQEKIKVNPARISESLQQNPEEVQPHPKDDKRNTNVGKIKRNWCYANNQQMDDIDWITKIKTFKITKVGKPKNIS